MMPNALRSMSAAILAALIIFPLHSTAEQQPAEVAAPVAVTVRIATFNIEDVRTEDVKRSDQPRLK
ncbi:MAG: hypothetical protein ACK58T_25510, partial [Phycisphaerae bacterium]